MPFDKLAAVAARKANPKLTPYDTGEMLEPKLWVFPGEEDTTRYGNVDFDNDEGGTEFTIYAHPSHIEDDTILIQIETNAAQRIKIVVNDGVLGIFPTE